MDNLGEVPQKAVVLLDESHLQYHTRASMASESRSVGSLINLTPEAVDSDFRHSRGQAAGPPSSQTVSGDRQPWTWVYSEEANYEGLVRNELASFWTPRLSHAFAQAPAEQRMPPSRRGSRPPRDELALKARRCTEQGFHMVRGGRQLPCPCPPASRATCPALALLL